MRNIQQVMSSFRIVREKKQKVHERRNEQPERIREKSGVKKVGNNK